MIKKGLVLVIGRKCPLQLVNFTFAPRVLGKNGKLLSVCKKIGKLMFVRFRTSTLTD